MITRRSVSVGASVLLTLSTVSPLFAAAFPDVPDGHVFQQEVESLVNMGVIGGNPDGKFYPDKGVNRAELLKMLYKAKGITPDARQKNCFKDVQAASWYEPYVCDAVNRKYVGGYPDSTFKPANPVNRVEALKMVTLVFGIEVPELKAADPLPPFQDVPASQWFTKYIAAAYDAGILPIAGQNAEYFYPDWSLLRGEAAAYIYNALHPKTASSAARSSSSVVTRSSRSTTSSAQQNQPISQEVDYPFNDSGTFPGKQSYSFEFDVPGKQVLTVEAKLKAGQQGGLSCRLYLINENGFSDQYYLGYEEGDTCTITATVGSGPYQLQLQPTVSGTQFDVTTFPGTGDNNDGFADAVPLTANKSYTHTIDARDIYDFYKFTVSDQSTMTVHVTNDANVRCIVYAMSDVDLYGFSGPQCNQSYDYPEGTYYVAVMRKSTLGGTHGYTLQLVK